MLVLCYGMKICQRKRSLVSLVSSRISALVKLNIEVYDTSGVDCLEFVNDTPAVEQLSSVKSIQKVSA